MGKIETLIKKSANRRTFLKTGITAAGAATMGAGLLGGGLSAFGQDKDQDGDITKGDIAILRFLNALEQIEADLWIQYSELGGTQDNEVSGVNGGNPLYTAALTILDGDMAQYIHDNTDDEISHAAFLKAYLESKGAEAVDLSPFATIPGSTATGSTGKTRLTNLMQAHRGHQLLVPVPQHHQPRFRSRCEVRSSRPQSERGATYGHPKNRRRHRRQFHQQ